MNEPYYSNDHVTIYHGDCREILPSIEADVLVTDPPYPNAAGHFDDGVAAAREVLKAFPTGHALVFWDEMTTPDLQIPLVARHIWHRTNTNRPDNYEAIFEFHADGRKRPSRVFPFAVIYPGLTGCFEATGHPTQKNEKLMRALVERTTGTILDPFMGSGTTLVAAQNLGRKAIGIELKEKWCEVAAKRLSLGPLFEPKPLPQPSMFDGEL